MAKKSSKSKGQKRTPATTRSGAGARAAKRSGTGAKRTGGAAKRSSGAKRVGTRPKRTKAGAKRTAGSTKRTAGGGKRTAKAARKTARSRTPNRKTVKRSAKTSPRPSAAGRAKTSGRGSGAGTKRREGGTGRERQLDQTPETGRSVKGPTNPFPTKRSTGTAAGAGTIRQAPDLERSRRRLREVDETVASPPSSLNLDRHASAARTGREEMRQARREHTEVSPEITAGDVDADWAGAYDAGDEAPGGDNPTPDQDRVDDIGKALGVEYEDNEELKGADKIAQRDKKRWELDPASSDDYQDRD